MNAMTSVRQRWKMAETLLAAPFPLASGENFSGFAARIESLRGKFALAEDADVDAAVEARFAPEFLTAGATARFRIYVVHRQRTRQRNRRRHPALIRSGPRRFPRSGFRRGMKW